MPLHTEVLQRFTHRSFYTPKLLHTETLTHKAFTHECLYAQNLVHAEAFAHRNFYTQTLLRTEACTILTEAFTQKCFYRKKPLYRAVFTNRKRLRTMRFYMAKNNGLVKLLLCWLFGLLLLYGPRGNRMLGGPLNWKSRLNGQTPAAAIALDPPQDLLKQGENPGSLGLPFEKCRLLCEKYE